MMFGPKTDEERQLANRIRADTPGWPVEAVDGWLFEIAKGYGWPPSEKWRYALNLRPFERWQQVQWERLEADPDRIRMAPSATQTIVGLIRAYGGERNAFSNVVNSKARIDGLANYISQHGTMPVAPLLIRQGNAFDLLDGSHRFAALFLVRKWKADGVLAVDPPIRELHQFVIANPPAAW